MDVLYFLGFDIDEDTGASHKKVPLLSNKTLYNPHDPDDRISASYAVPVRQYRIL
jgi:hypothetical protein